MDGFLWVKAFHVVAVVAWFAGLFYLPRLMVYHSIALQEDPQDHRAHQRFVTMEGRLYRMIMWPAGLVATALGFALMLYDWSIYSQSMWLHIKLILVLALWAYHMYCGQLLVHFSYGQAKYSTRFYRLFNEVPTVLLVVIICLVELKPL